MADQIIVNSTSFHGPAPEAPKPSFLTVPREIRNKIYRELLILRLTAEDSKIEKMIIETRTFSEVECDNHLDRIRANALLCPMTTLICPKRSTVYPCVALLEVNKQCNEEAAEILFGENIFVIMVDGERRKMFWHCGSEHCDQSHPCCFHFRHFELIRHLYIDVDNTKAFDDPGATEYARVVAYNLALVSETFTEIPPLKSLSIRYTSCFGGRLDLLKERVEDLPKLFGHLSLGDVHGGMSRPGNPYLYEFVLKFLDTFRGIQDVKIKGDVSNELITALTKDIALNPHKCLKDTNKTFRSTRTAAQLVKEQEKVLDRVAFPKRFSVPDTRLINYSFNNRDSPFSILPFKLTIPHPDTVSTEASKPTTKRNKTNKKRRHSKKTLNVAIAASKMTESQTDTTDTTTKTARNTHVKMIPEASTTSSKPLKTSSSHSEISSKASISISADPDKVPKPKTWDANEVLSINKAKAQRWLASL